MPASEHRWMLLRAGCVAAFALILGACKSEYLDWHEPIALTGGDAQATNRILQMRDPWPPSAWNKTIPHDGTRMDNAIDAYHRPRAVSDTTDGNNQNLANGPTTNSL